MVRGELPHTIRGVPLAASANGGQVQRLRCGLRSAIGKGGDPDYYRSDPLAASANGGDCSLGPNQKKKFKRHATLLMGWWTVGDKMGGGRTGYGGGRDGTGDGKRGKRGTGSAGCGRGRF